MDLKKVGNRFRSTFRILNGPKFYGQILDIPDTSRVSNFLSARRYLRTKINSIVKVADVIITPMNKYIVADHGEGFYVDPIYKHHKLFQVDRELNWTRLVRSKNPNTGLITVTDTVELGTAFLSVQPTTSEKDQILIDAPKSIIITQADLHLEDRLGNDLYVVTKVDKVLGVTLAELRET